MVNSASRRAGPKLATAATVLVAAFAALAACVGDDASTTPTGQPDGGGTDSASGGVDSSPGDGSSSSDGTIQESGTDTRAPFNPGSIAGLVLWLDGQDTASFTLGAGGTVTTWKDKSSASNHAASIAGSEPVRVDNATNKKVVRFVGPSQALVVADKGSLYFQSTDDFTIAMVVNFTHNGGGGFLSKTLFPTSPVDQGILFFTVSTNQVCFVLNGSCGDYTVTPNTYHRYVLRRTADGTQLRSTVDGVVVRVLDTPVVDVSNGGKDLLIGAIRKDGNVITEGMTGDIAEVIVYRTTSSDPDGGATNTGLNELDAYLKAKWGP